MPAAIRTEGLSRKYRHVDALDGLNLEVPEGAIYAYLGPNGAGKTTTIHLLLNLIQPSAGRAEVLGVDSTRIDAELLQSVGYVSENQHPPAWMQIGEFLDFCSRLYPTWDDAYCASLVEKLDLPTDRVIRHCSRGMKMKTALISSSAYRPQLLVLDEPFSGLDPDMRDDMIAGMRDLARESGCTIFISSHDLMELESLVDHVGYLKEGKLRHSEPLASLKARFRRVDVSGEVTPKSELRFVESQYAPDQTTARLRERFGPQAEIEVQEMSLREIFSELGREERGA